MEREGTELVPVADLIDLASLGRRPTPAQLRAALPPGWVLDEDGVTARRDARVPTSEARGIVEAWGGRPVPRTCRSTEAACRRG